MKKFVLINVLLSLNLWFTNVTWTTEDSSFLDVKITRQNKRFVTLIFRKAIFSGLFTNYDSFISDTYKIGLVHTLLFLFFKLCSSMENFHIEVELLKSIFKCNNYPVNVWVNVSKSSWTNCMSLNRLYQQYLKRNC